MSAHGFHDHNHTRCITAALNEAEAHCQAQRLQLTPVRRRVLEILLQEHRALGAYDILEVLRDEGLGSQPPVAYRALDFLVAHGFAHRVEQKNAFVACSLPGDAHSPVFLICDDCETVAEVAADLTGDHLGKAVADTGFRIQRVTIEARGQCPSCAGTPA